LFVAKNPERLIAVETVAHNQFLKVMAEELEYEDARLKLYVESQKHGIHKFPYTPKRAMRLFDDPDGPFRVYRFTGVAKGDAVAKAR